MNRKVKIARLSIMSNCILISMKFVVGIISGSVSIISEAIHSMMDLLAAIIAFFSVRISDNPPDKTHPYGHGKFENMSGVIEASLIFVAAFWIIYESIKKILHPAPVESIWLGAIVMGISALLNFIVSRKLYKVAKETDSIALEADALHLKTDVYTSLGVAVGLFFMMILKLPILDPIVAILVAIFILREALNLFIQAYSPLMDTALSNKELELIEEILSVEKLKYHNLRSRKAGSHRFLEFHLELPDKLPLKKAHDICDKIEALIMNKISNMEVTIHAEPFGAIESTDTEKKK
jgi:cation diffusion facilitator family transporter